MLYIYTDLENTNWLTYILEEFKRINNAKFPINICALQGQQANNKNIIYYTKDFVGKPTIPNKSGHLPQKHISVLNKDIFVFENTLSDDDSFAFNYDILWNSFMILSRYEEYLHEKNHKKIRSLVGKHPRNNKDTFLIPVVNYYFNELEQLIKRHFPELTFGDTYKPNIELSHDLDYIKKTLQLRLKQTAFNSFNALKSIVNPKAFFKNIGATIHFLFSTPSYWCFDYWTELEKKFNLRSVFYVYAKADNKNIKQTLIDPSYNIRYDTKLQKQLNLMLNEGFQIGLHGSYKSATNKNMLKKEKEILEYSLNSDINRNRQHWLNYQELKTPYAHNELFQYDSTLGWNDTVGFRSGCASIYRPYDHNNERPFNYYEIPQVIMDSHIFDYGRSNLKYYEKQSFKILYLLHNIKNAHVAISWHQRTCAKDYQWHNVYEKIIYEHL
jgi:hypothetical protein